MVVPADWQQYDPARADFFQEFLVHPRGDGFDAQRRSLTGLENLPKSMLAGRIFCPLFGPFGNDAFRTPTPRPGPSRRLLGPPLQSVG
jgi:hypothetical protein